ncbi:rRNA-processing protein FCF2 [Dendryphion nanum]|uniref:rRNA-processing protein FCF2 n=1 Tax=Dendryphion nanum TaxID=256645 RepID=A0A9P9DN92_9PLEO|nr:rRNA-processing protein FCF2 [Dendryphion nanum]
MAMPAHRHPPEDESDEELSDEQIRHLFDQAEAERLSRGDQSLVPSTATAPLKFPKLDTGYIADNNLKTKGSITRLDHSKLVDQKALALANGYKKIVDPVQLTKQRQQEKKASAGASWFNLPKTDLTPELRRDLQLLKMRSILDPKRFFKKSDSKGGVPEFSQVGTVIEGPTDYYNGRINNKDRKRTFVEEVLAQEEANGRFKKKYNDIQKTKTSGKKAFYKSLQAKRKSGRVEKR